MAPPRYRSPYSLLLLQLLSVVLNSAAATTLNILPAPSALNASNDQGRTYYCNSLSSWTGGHVEVPTYMIEDCNEAIRMFEQDVARHPGDAQWLSLGFRHRLPGYGTPVWTPKRYTSGKSRTRPLRVRVTIQRTT